MSEYIPIDILSSVVSELQKVKKRNLLFPHKVNDTIINIHSNHPDCWIILLDNNLGNKVEFQVYTDRITINTLYCSTTFKYIGKELIQCQDIFKKVSELCTQVHYNIIANYLAFEQHEK